MPESLQECGFFVTVAEKPIDFVRYSVCPQTSIGIFTRQTCKLNLQGQYSESSDRSINFYCVVLVSQEDDLTALG